MSGSSIRDDSYFVRLVEITDWMVQQKTNCFGVGVDASSARVRYARNPSNIFFNNGLVCIR